MTRPRQLIFVTGTATEVGKTFVAAATLTTLREAGLKVSARKPLQSFVPGAEPTDGEVLAIATGESPDQVSAPEYSYELPLAPPMAAARLQRILPTIAELAAHIEWPVDTAVGLIEGVGGPRSPLAQDGDSVDLIHTLQPDRVVIVSGAGLGAINAVRSTIDALGKWEPITVVLNRYDENDELHQENYRWLVNLGLDIVLSPDKLAEKIIGAAR